MVEKSMAVGSTF